jgi:hypothetical protein
MVKPRVIGLASATALVCALATAPAGATNTVGQVVHDAALEA